MTGLITLSTHLGHYRFQNDDSPSAESKRLGAALGPHLDCQILFNGPCGRWQIVVPGFSPKTGDRQVFGKPFRAMSLIHLFFFASRSPGLVWRVPPIFVVNEDQRAPVARDLFDDFSHDIEPQRIAGAAVLIVEACWSRESRMLDNVSSHSVSDKHLRTEAWRADKRIWYPAVLTASYPFLLNGFHALVTDDHGLAAPVSMTALLLAVVLMLGIFAVPLMGLILACQSRRATDNTLADTRARRFALLIVAVPTLYCFLGVNTWMLGVPFPDPWIWVVGWFSLAMFLTLKGEKRAPSIPVARSTTRLRYAHGIAGAVVLLFIAFHLFNHLFGLVSPQAHTVVMEMGRKVYRAAWVEPVLVVALLFQVFSGLRLAWIWSAQPTDAHRIFQLASGVFMAVFVIGHMNAVFIFARTVAGIDTGWAFASGDPVGMIHDAWSIRLLPHYALGVFFVLAHLFSGLRIVLLAHGLNKERANALWWAGAVASAAVSLLIMLGMTGLRLV